MSPPEIRRSRERILLPLDWRRRPLAFLAVAAAAALALAGVERFVAGRLGPADGGQWIWADGDYRDGLPIAFYAARDLELPAAAEARFAIVADETYVLYVNGQRVGAGSYRRGAPVDEHDVGHLLEPGLNRILVELRSSRGAGGLFAELEIDDGAGGFRALATGSDWRIFRRYDPALFGGWSGLEGGEAAKAWGRAPTGRWRLGRERIRRPIPFESALVPPRRRPTRFRQQQAVAPWVELDWSRPRIPALGPHQLYDWGETVEGYLSFDLTSAAGRPGLLYYGLEPPDPQKRHPDEVLLPVPGRRFWEAAFPRRFRYLLVVGAEPYSQVVVELVDPELARQLAAPADAGGVFGLAPPRSYSEVEENVYKRLGRGAEDDDSAQGGSIGSKVSTSSSVPPTKR